GFVSRIRDVPRDPVTEYLRAQLSSETRRLIDEFAGESPTDALLTGLVADVNAVLRGDSLYDFQRFRDRELSEEITALLETEATGHDLLVLTRLLLELVYPREIAATYKRYEVGEGKRYERITYALAEWRRDRPRHGVIEIADSGVYVE